ncbi:MAG: hypothetical protein QXW47_09915 [Candidatus Jordarchaeales archaeon]
MALLATSMLLPSAKAMPLRADSDARQAIWMMRPPRMLRLVEEPKVEDVALDVWRTACKLFELQSTAFNFIHSRHLRHNKLPHFRK